MELSGDAFAAAGKGRKQKSAFAFLSVYAAALRENTDSRGAGKYAES